jgi:nucleoside-diphosphate-sugar epimerase
METLVTGATGFVGPFLVSALRAQGHHVSVLAFPGENAAQLEQERVAIFRGNVCQPETLTAPMRGVETVFHLAAIHGLWRAKQDYYDVNVKGTENVCRAALAAGVGQMMHVSSFSVYGMAVGRPCTEEFPINPVADVYAITKAKGELVVQRYIKEHKLPAAIIRPGTMFGPGDPINFGRMADKLVAGKAVIIGSGRNALPLVYVTDAVQGMILAATTKAAVGQIYNIENDQPLTQTETWLAIAQDIGVAPPRLRVPYQLAYAIAYAAELAVGFENPKRQPLITRLGVRMFGGDNRHPIDKARRELGYEPQVSVRDGLRRAAAWYVEHRGASQPAQNEEASRAEVA